MLTVSGTKHAWKLKTPRNTKLSTIKTVDSITPQRMHKPVVYKFFLPNCLQRMHFNSLFDIFFYLSRITVELLYGSWYFADIKFTDYWLESSFFLRKNCWSVNGHSRSVNVVVANSDFAVLCLTQMFYSAETSSNCVCFSG